MLDYISPRDLVSDLKDLQRPRLVASAHISDGIWKTYVVYFLSEKGKHLADAGVASALSSESSTCRTLKGPFTSSVCHSAVRSLPNQNVWILSYTGTPSVSINASIKFICHLHMALQPIWSNVTVTSQTPSLSLDVHWVPLTTSTVTASTRLQRAILFAPNSLH